MLPYIIGGIAIAATGYGIKKFFNDERNYDKIDDALIRGYDYIDETDEKISRFFDDLSEGVGKLFDENKGKTYHVDLSPEGNPSSEFLYAINGFENAKRSLYKTTLSELHSALSEIKNLETDLAPLSIRSYEKNYFIFEDEDETIDTCASVLTNAKSHIDAKLDKLDTIIISSNDYGSYSDEDKSFVKELVELLDSIEKVSAFEFKDGDIPREAKRALAKIETILS